MARVPFEGVRILAVSRSGAGRFGTQALADHDTEIPEIDDSEVDGDVSRHVPPHVDEGDSLYFQSSNRGKKSSLPAEHRLMRGRGGRAAEAVRMRLDNPVETPEVEDLEDTDVAAAPPWMTILHNCDCHTFEQVVRQLMKAIGCTEERGWELAWQVHNTGRAVVKVGPETECVRVGNILAAIGLIVTVAQS
ncbi:MAG TPA: ATP-dependent Clp protease adaptor ClpS [Candidatus Methylomirabilis sp.]|nr:ATP-dependent Clp protease adaptor ClpS [Candidatus Methylomirabilis sp.]